MTSDATPVLDESVLDDLLAAVQGDRTFVVDLVEAHLADGAEHVAALEAAAAAGDLAAVVRPAHTLKSSSATVGATRLADSARSIEHAARDEDGAAVAAALATLRADWDEAVTALRAWLGRRT